MKEFCPLISDLFLFFSWHLWLISHFWSKFSKTKGGTLGWKKSEKNRFLCLIPQKNRLEKCRLKVKSVFKNIYFCGSYGPKSTKKCSKSSYLLKMPIFRYFLVHNFHKNQYIFKNRFHIFQGGSFEVSNIKIYFFHPRVPPLVLENFDRKWEINLKCQEKNKNRSEISG